MKQVINVNTQNIISIEEAVRDVDFGTIIICVNNMSLEIEFLMKDPNESEYIWRPLYTTFIDKQVTIYKTIKAAMEDAIMPEQSVYVFKNTKDMRVNLGSIKKQ